MGKLRFDRWTRTLATETSRRRTLQGLAGGALAGLLGHTGLEAAACVKPGKKGCKGQQNKQCCDGARCQGGTKKKEGRCVCKGSLKQCGTKCVNIKTDPRHCGACNDRCGNAQLCQGGACRDRRCGEGAPCRVFVTSSSFTGNIGGLAGADSNCQGLASDAGLPGTFKAWLSDANNSPATRFTNRGATGPYLLVNDTQIAADFADLTDGTLAAPIDVDEAGTELTFPKFVWTNTNSDGRATGLSNAEDHCASWTSDDADFDGNTGLSSITTEEWTDRGGPNSCNNALQLYCFEQG